MATKRTRAPRNIHQRVTPEALEHYRAALEVQDRYLKCLESDRDCGRGIGGVHCDECSAYLEHSRVLSVELRLRPWDPDPLLEETELTGELEALRNGN